MLNKLTFLKGIFALTVLGLLLTSCRMDDSGYEPLIPVKLTDIPGEYTGKTVTKSAQLSKTFDTKFEATADSTKIKEFPLEPIVRAVLTDPLEIKSALEELEEIDFSMAYTGKLADHQKEIVLSLKAEPLSLEIPSGDKTKSVVLTFKDPALGSYYATAKGDELYLGLTVKKIEVDGKELTMQTEMTYLVGGYKQ